VTRLLFIDQYGEMGGGQRILMSLLRVAARAGYQTTVLAPGGALRTAIAHEFGPAIVYVPCEEPRLAHGRKGFADILRMLAYGWRFRRHRPLLAEQDVIYVNGLRHLPHLLILARSLKARLIYHIHLRHSLAERLLLRLATRARSTFRLVVNSRFTRDTLGIVSSRIVLIENVLDSAYANLPFSDRFRDGGPWRAAVIGTLRPEKGQDIATAAISSRPDISLAIIGRDGDGVRDWADALRQGSRANVHFRGAVSNVAQELNDRGIQFSLVPSRWEEPFGLVAIESMACSCITIVSGRGGLAEIAERTGALVAADAESLGHTLDQLCRLPPASLAAMARAQHRAVQETYAPALFEAEIRKLLEAALKAAPAAL
jgi:glycosyltransferase involved in cell wall biosynthesis